MSRGIKILNGISNWIRESVGPEAANRGGDSSGDSDETDTDADEDSEQSTDRDSPVCCSAASNTDLTVDLTG